LACYQRMYEKRATRKREDGVDALTRARVGFSTHRALLEMCHHRRLCGEDSTAVAHEVEECLQHVPLLAVFAGCLIPHLSAAEQAAVVLTAVGHDSIDCGCVILADSVDEGAH
jgi:hypothetical protein